jgi:hypothetical protein
MKISQDKRLRNFLQKTHGLATSPERKSVATLNGNKLLLKSTSSVEIRPLAGVNNREKDADIYNSSKAGERMSRMSRKSSVLSKQNLPIQDKRTASPNSRISRDRYDTIGENTKTMSRINEDSVRDAAIIKRWYGSAPASPNRGTTPLRLGTANYNPRKASLSGFALGEKSMHTAMLQTFTRPFETKTRGFFKKSYEEIQFEKLKDQYTIIGETIDDGMSFSMSWKPSERLTVITPSQEKLSDFEELNAQIPNPPPEIPMISTTKPNRLELVEKQYSFFSIDLESQREHLSFSRLFILM